MSTLTQDGGPAFPVTDMQTAHRVGLEATNGTGHPESEYIAAAARATAGMTLRDYFAAKAEAVLEADGLVPMRVAKAVMDTPEPSSAYTPEGLLWWFEAEARVRYMKANAMLAARGGQ